MSIYGLIIEAAKTPDRRALRHVFCAESDEERDSWVDMLVRYHSGTFFVEDGAYPYSQNGIFIYLYLMF